MENAARQRSGRIAHQKPEPLAQALRISV